MKKRIYSILSVLLLLVTLCGQAMAIESPEITVTLNGAEIPMHTAPTMIQRTVFVDYGPMVYAVYPNAVVTGVAGGVTVQAEGLDMTIKSGASYIQCNGRYLYVEQGVRYINNALMVPARVLATALGTNVDWNGTENQVTMVTTGSAIRSGDQFYDSDSLYWLSHIINAEAGNQSLAGKVAVGNVVLNRVKHPNFPNTIKEVIYQKNQFTPAMTGSIKRQPNDESVIAAKLCLEGANTVGNSLYFVNPRISPNCWASRNRPYVATLGAHAFYA